MSPFHVQKCTGFARPCQRVLKSYQPNALDVSALVVVALYHLTGLRLIDLPPMVWFVRHVSL
jgi:hypothetical protein